MELAAKKLDNSTRNGGALVTEGRGTKRFRNTRKPARTAAAKPAARQTEALPDGPLPQMPVPATSRDRQAQEHLLEAHMPLVRHVAERIHRRLPAGVDLDSLVHSGVVGLLEALRRYDAGRGVAFQTYARYRIQGEIIEYLRSLDWVSRSVRAWGRKMALARTRLTGRFGREASPEEMASELGVPLTDYYRVDQKVNEAALLSLEDLTAASEEEWRRAQEESSQRPFQDPFAVVEGKDLVEKLTAAIEELPERERMIVALYYHEELTLKEIGEVLHLTEGRICQIHAQAVTRLQAALGVNEESHERAGQRPVANERLRRAA